MRRGLWKCRWIVLFLLGRIRGRSVYLLLRIRSVKV